MLAIAAMNQTLQTHRTALRTVPRTALGIALRTAAKTVPGIPQRILPETAITAAILMTLPTSTRVCVNQVGSDFL